MLDVVAGPGVVRAGHFLREIVPNRCERLYRFKGWAQLRGRERNGTFVLILSQWPRRTFLLAGLAVELTQLGSVSADYL